MKLKELSAAMHDRGFDDDQFICNMVAQLEARILRENVLPNAPQTVPEYSLPQHSETELLLDRSALELYALYLSANDHLLHDEITEYNNAIAAFGQLWDEYKTYLHRTLGRKPKLKYWEE